MLGGIPPKNVIKNFYDFDIYKVFNVYFHQKNLTELVRLGLLNYLYVRQHATYESQVDLGLLQIVVRSSRFEPGIFGSSNFSFPGLTSALQVLWFETTNFI